MSLSKLTKYLNDHPAVEVPTDYRKFIVQIIILETSDSKGLRLKNCVTTHKENTILWWCVKGQTTNKH